MVAATKIYTALDVLKLVVLGADAVIMQNNHLPGNNKKMIKTPPPAFLQDNWQLRNEILRSTIGLMNSFGYINVKEITLSSLLPRLNNFESMNTDMNLQNVKEDGQENSFRIIPKAHTEQSKGSVIYFN